MSMKTSAKTQTGIGRGLFASLPLLALAALLTAGPSSAAEDLPRAVEDLHLTEVNVRPELHHHHGRIIEGRLPAGQWIQIDLDDHDVVQEIETDHRAGFPLKDVSSLIPSEILNNRDLPEHALIEKIEFHDRDHIEIEGYDGASREFEAEFGRNGQLLELKID